MKIFFSSVSEIALISSLLAGVITIGADDDPNHIIKANTTNNHRHSITDSNDSNNNNNNDNNHMGGTIIHNNKNSNEPIIEDSSIHLGNDIELDSNNNGHEKGEKRLNDDNSRKITGHEPLPNSDNNNNNNNNNNNGNEPNTNPSKLPQSDDDREGSSSIIQSHDQDELNNDIDDSTSTNSENDSASQKMNDSSSKSTTSSSVNPSMDHDVEIDEAGSSNSQIPQEKQAASSSEDETLSEDNKKNKEEEQQKKEKEILVDYASKSVGAVILDRSPSNFKGTSNLLISDKDRYAITPCQDPDNGEKYVILGLSEDILVKTVKLANYERYSSHIHTFQLLGSQTYPMGKWDNLGTYSSPKSGWGEHTFELIEPGWARYLKFQFLQFYGEEHYCTVSQIKVHGSTTLQGFHEMTWGEEDQEDKEEEEVEIEIVDDSTIGHHDQKAQTDSPPSTSSATDQHSSPDNSHQENLDSLNHNDKGPANKEATDYSNGEEPVINLQEEKKVINEEVSVTTQNDNPKNNSSNDMNNVESNDLSHTTHDKLDHIEHSTSGQEPSSKENNVDDTVSMQNDSNINDDKKITLEVHESKNNNPPKLNDQQPKEDVINRKTVEDGHNKNKDDQEVNSNNDAKTLENTNNENPPVVDQPIGTGTPAKSKSEDLSDNSPHVTTNNIDDKHDTTESSMGNNYKDTDQLDDKIVEINQEVQNQDKNVKKKEDINAHTADLIDTKRENTATTAIMTNDGINGEDEEQDEAIPSSISTQNDTKNQNISDAQENKDHNTRPMPSNEKKDTHQKEKLISNDEIKEPNETKLGHNNQNCLENELNEDCGRIPKDEVFTPSVINEDSMKEEANSILEKNGNMISSNSNAEYDESIIDLKENPSPESNQKGLNREVQEPDGENLINDGNIENSDGKTIEPQTHTSSTDENKNISSEKSYSATVSNVVNGAIKKVTDVTGVKGGLKEIRNIITTSIVSTRLGGSTSNEETEKAHDIVHTDKSPSAPTIDSPEMSTKTRLNSSTATDQSIRSTTQSNKKVPINTQQQQQKQSLDNTILSSDLIIELSSRIPSIACLSTLNFSDWKQKSKSGNNSNSNMNTASQPQQASLGGNRNEPIFKKLHDEIKSLQGSQSLYDSYIRALSACYNQVLNDIMREHILMEQKQSRRIQNMEEQLSFLISDFELYRNTTGVAFWKKEFDEMVGFITDDVLNPIYLFMKYYIDPIFHHIHRLWNDEKVRNSIRILIDTIVKYEREAMSFAFGSLFCFLATSFIRWLERQKKGASYKKSKKKTKARRRKKGVVEGRPQHPHVQVDANIEIAEATTVVSWDNTSDGSDSPITIQANSTSRIA